MFLTKLNSFIKNKISFYINSPEFSKEFNDQIQKCENNYYRVFVSYDDQSNMLVYEFYNKENNFYLTIKVDRNQNIFSNINSNSNEYYLIYAFIYYINKKDLENFENHQEKYHEIYSVLPKFLQEIYALDENERQEIEDEVDYLHDIINKNKYVHLNDNPLNNQKINVIFALDYSVGSFEYSVKIGFNHFYTLKSPYSFINSIYQRNTLKASKNFDLTLSPSLFYSNDLILFNTLSTLYNQNNNEKTIDLADIYQIFILFENRKIIFENFDYFVNPIITDSKIYYDENNNISLTRLNRNADYLLSANYLIEINKAKKEINLLYFDSVLKANIYNYMIQNYNKLGLLKDFIIEQLGNNFINIITTKTCENSSFNINLYIDFKDNKLIFTTKYLLNDQEINPISINDTYIQFSVNYYTKCLESLNINDNSEIATANPIKDLAKLNLSSIKQIAKVFISSKIKNLKHSKLGNFSFKVNEKDNLLDFSFNENEYSKKELAKILNAYQEKKKYIIIGDKYFDLEENKNPLNELLNFVEDFDLDLSEEENSISIYSLFKLNNYLVKSNGITLNIEDKLREKIENILNFKNNPITLDQSLLSILRSYQLDGVKWLYTLNENNLCGILADDMGLGKTLEMITFLTTIKENAPILIVSPKNILYNWKSEINKWGAIFNVYVLSESKDDRHSLIKNINPQLKDIYITSYDSLKNDVDLYTKIHFSVIVLDEAQYIKNSEAKKTKAIKQLDSSSRFALTGTPIENHLQDLWSIFDFLMPKYLSSKSKFNEEYSTIIKNLQDEEYNFEINRLLSKIKPFILRRTKNEVLKDLPPKSEEIIDISLDEKQEMLYLAEKNKAIDSLNNEKNSITILAVLSKLREICVDPTMIYENYNELPTKIDYAINLIKNSIMNGHKILVFSQYRQALDHLGEELIKANIDYYYINGSVSAEKRLEYANEFNTKSIKNVFLVTLKAGGTGLNLIGADIVIHLDPWWNFASEDQATDRAYRIGQNNPVTVYKLIAHNTIEEKVVLLQKNKKDLYNKLIVTDQNKDSKFTLTELEYLLS